jgi:Raf kinase inhibitor-like YbhB/YbcL family protein
MIGHRLICASLSLLLASSCVSTASTGNAEGRNVPSITQAELERRTQALMDSVVPGDRTPWEKYYADDCLFFDEKGRSMNKTQLVADIAPIPKGYTGAIKLKNVQSRIVNDTAILSYDLDESETIWGQQLFARYHGTDTWMYRHGTWQIVATQVLRYYEDPATGKADAKRLADYAGTYELTPGTRMTVTLEDGQLFAQREARPRELLIPEGNEIFFRKGVEGRRLFRTGDNGTIDALIDRRNNEDVVWKKISVAQPNAFSLRSPAFREGETLADSTLLNGLDCKGANVSPALEWSNAPAATRSFALVLDDFEARDGDGFVHWSVYNIPSSASSLPVGAGSHEKDIPEGGRHAWNDFLQRSYGGPCPPEGPPHKYRFTIYALDLPAIDDAGTPMTWRKLRVVIRGHILGQASLTGLRGH